MLTKWSLQGFKAFREKADLEITPLTILAGANSSGKSTILQSILLLKQTVQYGAPTRPLSLNGPLIRLGTFDDIIPGVDDDAELRISFTFSVDEGRGYSDRSPWSTSIYRAYASSSNKMEEISGSFVWTPQRTQYSTKFQEQDRLKSSLKSGEIHIATRSHQEQSPDHRSATYGNDSDLAQFFGPEESANRWVTVRFDPLTEAELVEDKPNAVVGQMALSYFLPWYVSINYDAALKEAQDISEGLFGGTLLNRSKLDGKFISRATLDVINDWLADNGKIQIDTADAPIRATAVAEKLSSEAFSFSFQATLTRNPELAALQSRIQSTLISEIEPRRDNDIEQPRIFSSAAEYIRSYLKLGVRYLGPLRDEPKPVYPLEALENPTDVGYRGEHTAAVLYLNGSKASITPRPRTKNLANCQRRGTILFRRRSKIGSSTSELPRIFSPRTLGCLEINLK